jgi:streptogramin lyase
MGDGGMALKAVLKRPTNVVADKEGNLFIADFQNNKIRRIDTKGIISTVAGNGLQGTSGDGGPAAAARLSLPYGLAVDANGDLYIADTYNNRIRKVILH